MIRNILRNNSSLTLSVRGKVEIRGNTSLSIYIEQYDRTIKPHKKTLSTSSTAWKWSNKQEKDTTSFATSVDLDVQQKVLSKCESLYSSLMPLNEKIRGPLAKVTDRGTSLPFVFLVGNHSSGKSSFVNYLLGRNIQTSGVAPTDDRFTVISPGPKDTDQDGPALIGDPDMGFAPLRQFGPTLIHHTQLKIRNDLRDDINFMLIDSPGMIDSPTSVDDRGYDFPGVVKWFAERADVVLLFFDPDKPGTTGETMSVLLNSLAGMDHKLLIVLNKADQFKKIHDFARAYGSLCWNLSKVIPRKDLPRIYTMCLPIAAESSSKVDSSLVDLYQTRDEVVSEVMKAPKRRIDNVITHLNDSTSMLKMHALVCEDTRAKYAKFKWSNRLQEVSIFAIGSTISSIAVYLQLPIEFGAGVILTTGLGTSSLYWWNATYKLKEYQRILLTPEELSASFQRTHSQEILSDADEFTTSLWARLRDPIKISLTSSGLNDFPEVKRSDFDLIKNVLENEVPQLRRLASPSHLGSAQKKE